MKDERERHRLEDDSEEPFGSATPAGRGRVPSPRRNVPPPNAVPVFVFGLLGVTSGCVVLGIVAWVLGDRYLAACRRERVPPEGIGVAGRILGIVSTCLFGVGVLIVGAVFLFGALSR